jgi:hypothetical protein
VEEYPPFGGIGFDQPDPDALPEWQRVTLAPGAHWRVVECDRATFVVIVIHVEDGGIELLSDPVR